MSTMQSQQLTSQRRTRELSISSKQQPDSLPHRRPVGIQPRLAALVLAALSFSLILGYAAVCALTTRNGYAESALRREIEDVRAQTALLRYQTHLAESSGTIKEAAARLGLRPADPVREVDYVLLPGSSRGEDTVLAASDPAQVSDGLPAALVQLATEVMTSVGGRAEASTAQGHRP